jgi:hypothetical protein
MKEPKGKQMKQTKNNQAGICVSAMRARRNNQMGTMHLKAAVAIGIFWIGIGGTALAQSTVTVTVPGTSNPYLAGMPNGTTCCKGDSAPAAGCVPSLVQTGYIPQMGRRVSS